MLFVVSIIWTLLLLYYNSPCFDWYASKNVFRNYTTHNKTAAGLHICRVEFSVVWTQLAGLLMVFKGELKHVVYSLKLMFQTFNFGPYFKFFVKQYKTCNDLCHIQQYCMVLSDFSYWVQLIGFPSAIMCVVSNCSVIIHVNHIWQVLC